MQAINELLNEKGIRYAENVPLSELTTFRIGGPAALVIEPETAEQCAAVIRFARESGNKLLYLGNGSNVLASDNGTENWILHTNRVCRMELEPQGLMKVGAGVRLAKAAQFAAKSGFSGMEFAYGIPGTVGGAVFMNAGAYGGSMDQIVVRTDYLDENGVKHTLEAKDHDFSYRHSFFSERPDYLIVSTEIQCVPGDSAEIFAKMQELQEKRREKQPLEYPSAGSAFKRPEGYYAGKLIQDAGLRGFTIGGAQVSEKHCGFIINRGGATAEDVRRLIAFIQEKVKKESGVSLECEVRYFG